MLKFILGIVAALLCTAAFIVWTSLPENFSGPKSVSNGPAASGAAGAKTGEADTNEVLRKSAPSDEENANAPATSGSLFPKRDNAPATRGLTLGDRAEADRSAAANAPMRREYVAALGLGIDVPDAWLTLDANGMRRYFSEFQGLTDQGTVDSLVSTIALAAIRDWPVDGAVPNLILNHRLAPRNDVLELLGAVIDRKRANLDRLEIITPPSLGTLGGFSGGSLRALETVGTGDAALTRESISWILRVGDGYLFISADAPADDAGGIALIERMLKSVSAAKDAG